MMTRRNSLRGIIALGVAPAIIRVAPLMRINPLLALPASDLYLLCNFKSASMPGVALNMLRSGEARGWLLVARNVTTETLEVRRTLLRPGESYVLCSAPGLHEHMWPKVPRLI